MTQHVDPAAAARAATAVAAVLTTAPPRSKNCADPAELLRLSMIALESEPAKEFDTICDIERTDIDVLRAMPIVGTMFEVMARVAEEQGEGPCVDIGDIMAVYAFDRDDVHDCTCFCHEQSETISGHSASLNLFDLPDFRVHRSQMRALG